MIVMDKENWKLAFMSRYPDEEWFEYIWNFLETHDCDINLNMTSICIQIGAITENNFIDI